MVSEDVMEARSRRLGLQHGISVDQTVFLSKGQECHGVQPNEDVPGQRCQLNLAPSAMCRMLRSVHRSLGFTPPTSKPRRRQASVNQRKAQMEGVHSVVQFMLRDPFKTVPGVVRTYSLFYTE